MRGKTEAMISGSRGKNFEIIVVRCMDKLCERYFIVRGYLKITEMLLSI